MFTALHALAQKATLLIIVTAEDDGQLRVSVTPTHAGDSKKSHPLRPVSLVGTAEELNDGFAEAVAEWQAPRRSLVEQARDAAGEEQSAPGSTPKAKALPAPATKPGKAKGAPVKAAAAPKAADKASTDTTDDEAASSTTGQDDGAAPTAGQDAASTDTTADDAASTTTGQGADGTVTGTTGQDDASTASTTTSDQCADGAPGTPPVATAPLSPAHAEDPFTLEIF